MHQTLEWMESLSVSRLAGVDHLPPLGLGLLWCSKFALLASMLLQSGLQTKGVRSLSINFAQKLSVLTTISLDKFSKMALLRFVSKVYSLFHKSNMKFEWFFSLCEMQEKQISHCVSTYMSKSKVYCADNMRI